MKFLKRSFCVLVLILTWLAAILLVRACIPYFPQWLMGFFTGSEFGRFFFEGFLNVALLGVSYGLQKWIQRLYLQSKGQNGPMPKPRPIRRPAPPPEQTVRAKVVALRKKVKQRKDGWDETKYMAGFRLEDSGEIWLPLSEGEFRRLSEGDRGQLTFLPLPGRRYVSFLRDGEGVGTGEVQ